VVPGHVLQPGETYHYWVYIYDGDMETRDVDNLSMQGVFSSDLTRFDVSETSRPMGLMDIFKLLQVLTREKQAIPYFDLDVNRDNRLDMKDTLYIFREIGDIH
jgi:hypothetical protein